MKLLYAGSAAFFMGILGLILMLTLTGSTHVMRGWLIRLSNLIPFDLMTFESMYGMQSRKIYTIHAQTNISKLYENHRIDCI